MTTPNENLHLGLYEPGFEQEYTEEQALASWKSNLRNHPPTRISEVERWALERRSKKERQQNPQS